MNTKLKLIKLLNDNRQGLHLRELSRLLHTGMPNVKRYTEILEKEQAIKKQKEANLIKLKLKNNPRTIAYLKQTHTEKFLKLPDKIQNAINDFITEVEIKPLITLIFGSYAKGNYTKESDIDLFLVFQNVENAKQIENTAKNISLRTNTQINIIYVNYKNFEKNFLNKEHDFSKEIKQNVIIISGIELYYTLFYHHKEKILNTEEIQHLINKININKEEIQMLLNSKETREKACYDADKTFQQIQAKQIQQETAEFVNKMKNPIAQKGGVSTKMQERTECDWPFHSSSHPIAASCGVS